MEDLALLQLAYQLAWHIAEIADADPVPGRRAIHRFNDRLAPSPLYPHTECGLMLEVIDDRDPQAILTPWGRWNVVGNRCLGMGTWSRETTARLIEELGAVPVPEDDVVYSPSMGGIHFGLGRVYEIRRFAGADLPAARSCYPDGRWEYPYYPVLYPHEKPAYWAKVGACQALCRELNPWLREQYDSHARAA